MPGKLNEPDGNFRHTPPQQGTAGTEGEFTQIFSVADRSQSFTAAVELARSGSADDEFDKLFAMPPAVIAQPADPPQQAAAGDATLIFEALPSTAQQPVQGASTAGVSQPVVPAKPIERPLRAAPENFPSPSSEFTQVFSQVAPPGSPPPANVASERPPVAPSGEFTQFFSAISARESVSQPPLVSRAAQTPVAATAGIANSRSDAARSPAASVPGEVPRPSPTSWPQPQSEPGSSIGGRANPLAFSSAPSDSASALTQVFHPESGRSEPPRAATPPVASPSSAAAGDSFTQIFQQIAPPPQLAQAAAPSRVSAPPQSFSPPAPVFAPAPQDGWPAFGPPPQPGGSFTDVFAAQPPSAPGAWPSAPSQPGPPVSQASGGFTELFRELPASQHRAESSPFANFDMPAQAGAPAWPAAPRASQVAPPVAGSGDFTRLMQSLTPGAQGSASAPAPSEAFFAPASGSAHQESEFTRVQRASSRREASVAAPSAAGPVASVAPGLAVASRSEKAPEKETSAKKSKTLVILLVAMNVLLLLALIIVGFIVLRRK